MKLGKDIMKILGKTYEPDTMIERQMGNYDLLFKTDPFGQPILLFLGKADEKGKIRGVRFARRLVRNTAGEVIKDHWDNKGRLS